MKQRTFISLVCITMLTLLSFVSHANGSRSTAQLIANTQTGIATVNDSGLANCEIEKPVGCFWNTGEEPPENIQNWSGGVVYLTDPVSGDSFQTPGDMDSYCNDSFGPNTIAARTPTNFTAWFGGSAGSGYSEPISAWVVNESFSSECVDEDIGDDRMIGEGTHMSKRQQDQQELPLEVQIEKCISICRGIDNVDVRRNCLRFCFRW